MKNGLIAASLVILFLAALVGLSFATGYAQNWYDATVGRQHMDVQRKNFEHSQSYVQGKIEDLAKYKREYERAQTKDEKAQVRNYILDDFANFDANQIQNQDLYNFLMDMEGNR